MKQNTVVEMNNNDVCFQTPDKRRFRLRAAGIIIEDGCILFATNAIEKYYYSIGGAINLGETAEEAVVREIYEETGVQYEIDRLAFVQENFFKRDDGMFKGLSCHEITFYFLMKPRGTQQLDSHSITAGVEEKMCWLPIDNLAEYDIYPKFFIHKLKDLKPYPEHIVVKQFSE